MLHLHSDAYANRALGSTATTRAQAQAPTADDTAEEDLPKEPLRKVSKLCQSRITLYSTNLRVGLGLHTPDH